MNTIVPFSPMNEFSRQMVTLVQGWKAGPRENRKQGSGKFWEESNFNYSLDKVGPRFFFFLMMRNDRWRGKLEEQEQKYWEFMEGGNFVIVCTKWDYGC